MFVVLFVFVFASLLVFNGVCNASTDPMSLAGQWRFARDRKGVGVNEHGFARDLPDKVNLPGALQSQGDGDQISTNTPWVLWLYDKNGFLLAE
jgi:beta-galactosidase